MNTFEIFFGLVPDEILLCHTDNHSRTFQSTRLSAAEGQVAAAKTKNTLSSIRSDSNYELFWKKVSRMKDEVDVDEPEFWKEACT